ncbi:alpha/beta fold hydrolase [Kocuria sp. M1R5S2]|uniref:alpha/beta fold hydrolase n=1 Tax=Kocuria rhizosphaerae TaxID=3376285 RepID=UPI00378F0FC3
MAEGTGRPHVGPGGDVPGSTLQNPAAERRSTVLDGHKVRYWFYDVDRRPKPLLLMVHGFRGDHHGLQLVADRLREHYHVVVPDLPGFGRSEPFPDRPHDVAGYVEFLRGFVEDLTGGAVHDGRIPDDPVPGGTAGDDDSAGTSRAGRVGHGIVVLGHSFGSVLAAHFAAAHPAMVERLVLVNPICRPPLDGEQAVLSRLTATYYRLGRALPGPLGRRLLSSGLVTDAMSEVMTKSQDPQVRGYVRHQHRAYFTPVPDRDVLMQAYEASISHTVAEVAVRLTMPTLLVVGDEDEIGSVADQRRMASWIRRHRLEVLEGVGHLIHYEAPARAAELVRDFLTSPAPEPVELHDQLPAADLAAPNTSQFTGLQRIVRRERRR